MSHDATTGKITRKRPTKYPRQLAVMMTEDLYAGIEEAAIEQTETSGEHVSKATVARRWLEAGRAVTDAAAAAVDEG